MFIFSFSIPQAKLRATNSDALEAQLRRLAEHHAVETRRLVEHEQACMAREAREFALARCRIRAQLELTAWLDEITLATLDVPLAGPQRGWREEAAERAEAEARSPSPLPRRRARQEPLLTVVPLPNTSEVGRFVLDLVERAKGSTSTSSGTSTSSCSTPGGLGATGHRVDVVAMYYLHNSAAERRFHAACAASVEQEERSKGAKAKLGRGGGKDRPQSAAAAALRAERVFFCAPPHLLESALMVGHGATGQLARGGSDDALHAFHSHVANAVLMGVGPFCFFSFI